MTAETLKLVVPLVATLTGVLLGWFLNELREFFKIRRENRKIVNSVLFDLLEIRYFLIRTDLEKLIDFVINYIKDRYGLDMSDVRKHLSPFLKMIVKNIIADQHREDIEAVGLRYESSIKQLAKIDPILAYQISGKLNIYNYLDYLQKIWTKVEDTLQDEIEDSNTTFGLDEIKDVWGDSFPKILYEGAMKVITEDIELVAKKLGRSKLYRTKKVFAKQDKPAIHKEIEQMLEKYLPMFEGIVEK